MLAEKIAHCFKKANIQKSFKETLKVSRDSYLS